jgi:hypothetical protein
VPDPFHDRLNILIQPQLDPAKVAKAIVEFQYTDSDNQFRVHKQLEVIPTGNPLAYRATNFAIPLMDAARTAYTYKVSLYGVDNSVRNLDPIENTNQLTIVIGDGSINVEVNVSLLGDLASARLAGLQVELRCTPPDGEEEQVPTHLFEVGPDRKWTQRLRMRPGPVHFEYRTTAYSIDGDPFTSAWLPRDNNILVLQPARLVQR